MNNFFWFSLLAILFNHHHSLWNLQPPNLTQKKNNKITGGLHLERFWVSLCWKWNQLNMKIRKTFRNEHTNKRKTLLPTSTTISLQDPPRKQNWNIYQLKFTAKLKTKQTHTFRRVMEQKINLKTKIIPVIVEWSENIKLWKTHSQNAERKALKYPRKNASATTKKTKQDIRDVRWRMN